VGAGGEAGGHVVAISRHGALRFALHLGSHCRRVRTVVLLATGNLLRNIASRLLSTISCERVGVAPVPCAKSLGPGCCQPGVTSCCWFAPNNAVRLICA
jgi:hypothetical protein